MSSPSSSLGVYGGDTGARALRPSISLEKRETSISPPRNISTKEDSSVGTVEFEEDDDSDDASVSGGVEASSRSAGADVEIPALAMNISTNRRHSSAVLAFERNRRISSAISSDREGGREARSGSSGVGAGLRMLARFEPASELPDAGRPGRDGLGL